MKALRTILGYMRPRHPSERLLSLEAVTQLGALGEYEDTALTMMIGQPSAGELEESREQRLSARTGSIIAEHGETRL